MEPRKELDIVILSYAKTPMHWGMTQRCIDSILVSSADLKFNILVTETAEKMPSLNQPKPRWAEDKCYGVEAKDGVFQVGHFQYKSVDRYSGFVWIEEREREILARFGANFESFAKKTDNCYPYWVKQDGPVAFFGAETVRLTPFNYNKCINYAIDNPMGSEWLVVMNNDTLVKKNAFDKMIAAGYDSVSPKSDIHAPGQIRITNIEEGYRILEQVSGFCIMTKRDVFKKFPNGHMDEQFDFLHQDCDYAMTLMKLGIKHAIVPDAIVSHLHEQSHNPLNTHIEQSKESTRVFFNKWPSDYGVWATGNHAGCWPHDVIHDKGWRDNFRKKTKLKLGYGER